MSFGYGFSLPGWHTTAGGLPLSLYLPFSTLRDSTGSDGRASTWWNLFNGSVATPDVTINPSTGALTYGPHNLLVSSGNLSNAAWTATLGASSTTTTVTIGTGATSEVRQMVATATASMSFTVQAKVSVSSGTALFRFTNTHGGVVANYSTNFIATTTPQLFSFAVTNGSSAGDGKQTFGIVNASDASSNGVTFTVIDLGLNIGPLQTYVPTTTAAIYSLAPRITFYRGSLATMVGPAGTVVYAPHNLLTYSESLNTTNWSSSSNLTFTSGVLAPDNTNSAFTITATLDGAFLRKDTGPIIAGSANAIWVRRRTGVGYIDLRDTNNTTVSLTYPSATWQKITAPTSLTSASGYFIAVCQTSGDSFDVWHPQQNVGTLQPYYPTSGIAYHGPRFTYNPATAVNTENYGVNLVTNGDFSSSAGWTLGIGWAIAGGLATKTAGTGDAITRVATLVSGKVYRFTYTVSGASAGTCAAAMTGGTQVTGSLVGTNGTRIEFLTATSGNSTVGVTANGAFDGSIDNLSVQEYLGITSVVPATPLGFLPEEQRTNLLPYSTDFSANWSFGGATRTANAAIAPDGSNTGVLLTALGNNTPNNLTVTATSATVAYTVFVKRANADTPTNFVRFGLYNATTAADLAYANVNYLTGAVTLSGPQSANAIAISQTFPNGWFRIGVVITTGVTLNDTCIAYLGAVGATTTAGDSFYVWGAQLEAGSAATSYIPTTSASVTRLADINPMIGTDFSSWYNQNSGTLLMTFAPTATNNYDAVMLTAAAAGNLYGLYRTGSNFAFICRASGATQNASTIGAAPTGTERVAFTYEAAGSQVARNGALVMPLVPNPVLPSAISSLNFGTSGVFTGGYFNGPIASISYYNLALSAATLQTITA